MKNKKLLAVVVAFTMGATMLGAVGCEDKKPEGGHQHTFVWGEVTKQPTCTADGEQIGVCEFDNVTTLRRVPALGHNYGEWTINPVPQETSAGKAVKVCANDADNQHPLSVILPKLSDESKYHIEEVTGGKSYTFRNANGDITFNVKDDGTVVEPDPGPDPGPINPDTDSVADAVTLGTSDEMHAKIRKGSGKMGSVTLTDVSYTYGKDFVYVNDGANKAEYYYSLDKNGEIFPVKIDKVNYKYEIDGFATRFSAQGFKFYLAQTTGNDNYYGVEDLVYGLYDWGLTSGMYAFEEKVKKDEEKGKVYNYSYAYYNGGGAERLHEINVDFTLSAEGFIDWVNVVSTGWLKGNYTLDDTNYTYTVINRNERSVTDKIEVTQEAKTEQDAEPVNPYSKEKCQIQSYTVNKDSVSGAPLTEGELLEYNVDDVHYVYIKDVLPQMQIESGYTNKLDEFKVYYVNAEGKEVVSSVMDSTFVSYYNVSENKVLLRGKKPGEYPVIIRTRGTELRFKVKVNALPPTETAFVSNVYTYSAAQDKYLVKTNVNKAEVFKDKNLYFSATVTNVIYNGKYTVNVTGGTDYTVTDGELDGTPLKVFKANTAGTYTITLKSASNAAVSKSISVVVKELPDMAELLNGQYVNVKDNLNLNITPSSAGALNGSYSVTDAEATYTAQYAYVNGNITCTGGDLTYKLGFNDNYDLVILSKLGTKEVKSLMARPEVAEAVTLYGTSWESADGKYSITFRSEADCPDKTRGTFTNKANGTKANYFMCTLTPGDGKKTNITFETDSTYWAMIGGTWGSQSTAGSLDYSKANGNSYYDGNVDKIFINVNGTVVELLPKT